VNICLNIISIILPTALKTEEDVKNFITQFIEYSKTKDVEIKEEEFEISKHPETGRTTLRVEVERREHLIDFIKKAIEDFSACHFILEVEDNANDIYGETKGYGGHITKSSYIGDMKAKKNEYWLLELGWTKITFISDSLSELRDRIIKQKPGTAYSIYKIVEEINGKVQEMP